ncbi:uncharacterized mitochondrial protein AtMg01250-like [Helianthus annuus]|uniref:uncharacterized mitochondrial protein AtMg01250-like n=1 Tax=Helianthus annuus TaxID=4232 RepID=UPI000B907664|nr:uncharacterized mitochondrial protein AtMg01250-like [Helianthus annuus]
MAQMNFPLIRRRWILATITSAQASVLVNGSPTQEFNCYRGLRQGDPLSPFLFLIIMEALTCVVKEASMIGLYKGISCAQSSPCLSHFFYADDAVFVGEWPLDNARKLNKILCCFYLSSGPRVNLAKSSLFGLRVNEANTQEMASILRCKVGKLPFVHMGLQVGANMNLVKHWKLIIDVF